MLPNNSLVTVTVPPSNIVADAAASLRCVTARVDCCSDNDTAVAQWYHPNGGDAASQVDTLSLVRGGEGGPLGFVALVRAEIIETLDNADMGIYRCVVPEPGSAAKPATMSYYVGLYNNEQGESGRRIAISGVFYSSQSHSRNYAHSVYAQYNVRTFLRNNYMLFY